MDVIAVGSPGMEASYGEPNFTCRATVVVATHAQTRTRRSSRATYWLGNRSTDGGFSARTGIGGAQRTPILGRKQVKMWSNCALACWSVDTIGVNRTRCSLLLRCVSSAGNYTCSLCVLRREVGRPYPGMAADSGVSPPDTRLRYSSRKRSRHRRSQNPGLTVVPGVAQGLGVDFDGHL